MIRPKNVHIVGPYSFETDMAVLLGISWLADVTSIWLPCCGKDMYRVHLVKYNFTFCSKVVIRQKKFHAKFLTKTISMRSDGEVDCIYLLNYFSFQPAGCFISDSAIKLEENYKLLQVQPPDDGAGKKIFANCFIKQLEGSCYQRVNCCLYGREIHHTSITSIYCTHKK